MNSVMQRENVPPTPTGVTGSQLAGTLEALAAIVCGGAPDGAR